MFKCSLLEKPGLFALCMLSRAPTLTYEDICLPWFWILQSWSEKKPSWNLISIKLDAMRVIQMISALAALIFVRVVLVPCRSGMQKRQQTLWQALANVFCA